MDRAENRSVMERVMDDCRRAYQSRTPLIMIDTMEYELVEDVALSGELVALVRRPDGYLDKELAYYEFIRSRPDRLSRCENLFFGPDKLHLAAAMDGDLERAGQPGIYVVALEQDSPKPRQGEHGAIPALRSYVRSYLSCRDNSSPLRCSCVLLYGDISLLPADLQPYTELVEVPFPSKRELMRLLETMCAENGHEPLSGDDMQELVSDLAGLGLYDARRLVFRLFNARTERGVRLIDDPPRRRRTVMDMKKQSLLRHGGLLTLCKPKKGALAGMSAYTRWVNDNKSGMLAPEDCLLERGTPPLNGVLLCGVPGCGKSEAAKILYYQWDEQLPLLLLSVDQLMGGYVGDSERNMRLALSQAEAMAPCILWIEELDKGFSAASSGSDSGTFKRMFGRLLEWMQDKERACFIFATANDISRLPREFFRSCRFDELFAVFMPTYAECLDLFREQMRRAERSRLDEARSRGLSLEQPLLFDNGVSRPEDDCYSAGHCLDAIMAAFTETGKFLTGADISKVVVSALRGLGSPLDLPIKAADWAESVCRLARSATLSTYGSSSENLDSIAACYLRLLRGNFVPAADGALFRREYLHRYEGEDGRLHVKYELPQGVEPPQAPYDRALYDELSGRFPRIADRLENNALNRLCAG